TLTARNTIIAGNTAPTAPDLSGSLGSQGHNLIGNTEGGSGFHETDLLNVNPLLGPLQDNGGPTLTHALLPGSPAIDGGDPTDAPEWDQRGEGFYRVVGKNIDIGAYEDQGKGRRPSPGRVRPAGVDFSLILTHSGSVLPNRECHVVRTEGEGDTGGRVVPDVTNSSYGDSAPESRKESPAQSRRDGVRG